MNIPVGLESVPQWRQRVARAFSRAAPRYAALASAQQSMGERLWAHLPEQASIILDLGCGPGHWSARLAERYPQARVLGLDLASGMLREARRQHGDAIRWLGGDATALPLAGESLDLAFSNLTLQWCPAPEPALEELYRVLRPDGRGLINTLGPGTLAEVARAWGSDGLLDFYCPEDYRRAAVQAGFRDIRLRTSTERFYYPTLEAVMASIKGVGAQVARPASRLTRADLLRARQRFETLREPEGLPVTYHLITLMLERP